MCINTSKIHTVAYNNIKRQKQENGPCKAVLASHSHNRTRQDSTAWLAILSILFLASIASLTLFSLSAITGHQAANSANSTEGSAENETTIPNNASLINNTVEQLNGSMQNLSMDVPQDRTENQTYNETAPAAPRLEVSIGLISPVGSTDVSPPILFEFTLNSTQDIERCSLYTLFRYIEEDYGQTGEDLVPSDGINTFELTDMPPGEYLWKVGCSDGIDEVFSDEETFIIGEQGLAPNIPVPEINLSNLSQGIRNVTLDIYNITKAPSTSLQGDAVVGVPVNWTKVIIVNNTGDITVRTFIHREASDLKVFGQELPTRDLSGVVAAHEMHLLDDSRISTGKPIFLTLDEDRIIVQKEMESPTAGAIMASMAAPCRDCTIDWFPGWVGSLFGITGAAEAYTHPVELIEPADEELVGRNLNMLYETDREFDECSLYINGSLNQTDILVLEGINFFEMHGLGPGNYSWKVVCALDDEMLYSVERSFASGEEMEFVPEEDLAPELERMTIYALPEESGAFMELNITDNITAPKVYEITYQTPAPVKAEIERSQYVKSILISSNTSYSDVLSSTEVPWVPEWMVRLYETESSGRVQVNATLIDSDSDSLIDRVEWVVPHLSDKEYELDLSYDIPEINITSLTKVLPDTAGYGVGYDPSSGEDVLGLLQSNATDISVLAGTVLVIGFGSDITMNDTISVYAWSDEGGKMSVIDVSSGETLGSLNLVRGSWEWYNITVEKEFSGFSVGLDADSAVVYGAIKAFSKRVMIPKRIRNTGQGLSAVFADEISGNASEQRQFTSRDVLLTDPAGNRISSFGVYFSSAETDIDLSGIFAETDIEERKSVVHSEDNPLVSREKTLYIPSTGEGIVYICPEAASIADINPDCTGFSYVYPGENILTSGNHSLTVTMEEKELDGRRTYVVDGITGTGGGEAIRIINIHSHPSFGANWTVMFTTEGAHDLEIRPFANTTFSEFMDDDNLTIDDLELLELRCGDVSLHDEIIAVAPDNTSYALADLAGQAGVRIESLLVRDYSCATTGFLTVRELTGGHHYVMFTFGDQYAIAENYVSELYCEITPLCLYTDVLHISSLFNAHAELSSQSNYGNIICCREVYGEVVGTECSADDAEPILHLESESNAHVEKVSESNYAFDVCLSGTENFNITCDYSSGCGGYDTCMASISSEETGSDTNLMIGNCTGAEAYSTKICCDTQVMSTCVTPYDDYTATQDITFCPGTYYINDSAADGLIKFGSDDMTVTCNDTVLIGDSSGIGMYVHGKRNISLIGCTIMNYTQGVFFNNTDDSVLRNNSLFDDNYGVYLLNSTGNTIYHNNFTGSLSLHAFSSIAGNHFNTTSSGTAQGNYWDDVAGLEIYDTDADGFGDFGEDYPYSIASSSMVSANVTDWGPFASRQCADSDEDGYGVAGSNISHCTYSHAYDCEDRNASILPPRDDLNITQDTLLCNGTYHLNDSYSNGVVNIKSSGITLRCNGTVIIGNGSGYGLVGTLNSYTMRDCSIVNYSQGVRVSGNDILVANNTLNYTGVGLFGWGGTSNNITFFDNTVYRASGMGIELYGTRNGTIEGNRIIGEDFTDQGIRLLASGVSKGHAVKGNWIDDTLYGILATGPAPTDCTYLNNTITSAGTYGIYVTFDRQNITRNNIIGAADTDYGIFVGDSRDSTVHDNIVMNVTSSGVWIYDANSTAVRNNSLGYTGLTAISVSASYNNTFRNNTVYNNSRGINITSGTGNIFYHNSFSNSSEYYAFSAVLGNEFNTTVADTAQGNYWSGIGLLKIFDSDDDGFGDMGVQYPYSAANGGGVSAFVSDWGPITTRSAETIGPPSIMMPENESIVTDSRNPLYAWNNSEHTISDDVTYEIQVDDEVTFGSPVIYKVNITEGVVNTTYWNSSSLDFSKTYYWHVRANDTYDTSMWSGTYEFIILPTTSCTQPVDEIDFGTMNLRETNDTLNFHPEPYFIVNDGNLEAKGKVYSTNLWESPTWESEMPNEYYQFRVGENETGSYSWALDSAWVDMTNLSYSATEALYGYRWENVSDAFNLHIKITVPDAEPAGAKYSTTYVICEQNETY